jgi:RHS repeat-associated protein
VGSGTNTGTNGRVYDFENRLIQQGGISIVYDGNGNRVSKTVAGVTTIYWVAEQSPTGYAQVVEEEAANGAALESYAYGLEQIARLQMFGTAPTVYYVHDGHGSVRALTNTSGTVTDTYDYDAFGNLIHQTGTTPNNYLFAGEQFDPDLHLYYNRARSLNTSTGRFWSIDTDEGKSLEPLSLHKYLYASGDSVNRIDPTGNDDIAEFATSFAIDSTLNAISAISLPGGGSASQFVASLLLPSDILQSVLSLTPDAIEVGANVSATVNLRNPVVGFTAGGGAEFLYSPKTSKWALYTYVSPVGLTAGSTSTSLGVGGTAGLVFRAPDSSEYEGQFYTITVPMAALPSNVRTKIAGDWSTAPFQGIGAVIPPQYTSLLAAISYGLGNAFSNNGSVSFFISPTGKHCFGLSLGLGKSGSVGAGTSNWSVAWSYYWQDAPSGPVPFE